MPTPSPVRPDRPAPAVTRAHHLMLGLYGLLGITVATWLSRLPTVRTAVGLSTGELGTVLLVGAVGSLLTVLGAGAVVQRWGSRRVLVASAVVHSTAFVLLGAGAAGGSVAVLVVGVFAMSASFALANVPLNVETAAIERAMGRTVVPRFHAAFSIGSVAGSGLGALAAWAGVPPVTHFAAVAVGAFVWRWYAIPDAVLTPAAGPRPEPVPDAGRSRRGVRLRASLGAWRERRTLLVGVVVLTAALSEGSANNWLAIGVVDGFAAPEATGALVFSAFVASMTAARLLGTRLIDRHGRPRVLAASSVVSLVGLVLFGTAPTLPLAVVGVAMWGLGAGLGVPIGMVAVAEDPLRAASRVAVVSAFASVASLAAPPLLGLAAESLGVRHALLLVGVGMVVSVALARQVGPSARVPAPHGQTGRRAAGPASEPTAERAPELGVVA